MKSLNNAGIKEIVYLVEYKRIKEGGNKTVAEDEAWELAQKSGIAIRKYEGSLYFDEKLFENQTGVNKTENASSHI